MTSHDVVAKIRRGLKIKKVGHAGTLDPMATGVLIVCLGGATRLSEYVMASTKRYQAKVQLGVVTDTYDAEGEVVQIRDASAITSEAVIQGLNNFRGSIQQVPPMYSAIKKDGRKLYDLARAGETIERESRPVTIEHLEVSNWSPPQFTLDVVCSAGTYIRSLAYDLGEVLGVGAHLTGLTRVASGGFTLESAVTLDNVLSASDWSNWLVSPTTALSHYPAVHLTSADVENIQFGRAIVSVDSIEGQTAFAYDEAGELVAVLIGHSGLWRPHKVFSIPE